MTDQPESDSDLRRRAAWLLAMLAVVAVLFVLLLTTLLDSSGGDSNNNAGPDDTLLASPTSTGSTAGTSPSSTGGSTPATPRTTASTASTASTSPPAPSGTGTRTCPTAQKCALEGDYGKAVDAINAYRTQHGKKAVPGAVSKAAQECAKNNGSGCKGGWAESQVPSLDGDAAVKKVQQLGKLLDPMKSFSVGWAYDPPSKQYYFAVIRQN